MKQFPLNYYFVSNPFISTDTVRFMEFGGLQFYEENFQPVKSLNVHKGFSLDEPNTASYYL